MCWWRRAKDKRRLQDEKAWRRNLKLRRMSLSSREREYSSWKITVR